MEKNRNILKHALQSLPAKDPPDEVWSRINNQLTKKEKLAQLTKYEPPRKVWNRIEQQLATNKRKSIMPAFIKWSVAAAAIIVIGYFVYINDLNGHQNINYSEKWVSIQNPAQWNDHETPEAILSTICELNPTVCNSPDFKKIKANIEQLEKTKQIILRQFNKYEPNTELEIMLTKIKLEQAGLIKQMIYKTTCAL